MMHKDLKVGDQILLKKNAVLVNGGWGVGVRISYTIAETVKRVTANQAATEGGTRFRLKDGVIIAAEGIAYPVGYVEPGENPRPPMAPTSEKRMADIREAQMALRQLNSEIERFTKGKRDFIKGNIESCGLTDAIAEIYSLASALSRFMDGAE